MLEAAGANEPLTPAIIPSFYCACTYDRGLVRSHPAQMVEILITVRRATAVGLRRQLEVYRTLSTPIVRRWFWSNISQACSHYFVYVTHHKLGLYALSCLPSHLNFNLSPDPAISVAVQLGPRASQHRWNCGYSSQLQLQASFLETLVETERRQSGHHHDAGTELANEQNSESQGVAVDVP
jgi:hypothetical protein